MAKYFEMTDLFFGNVLRELGNELISAASSYCTWDETLGHGWDYHDPTGLSQQLRQSRTGQPFGAIVATVTFEHPMLVVISTTSPDYFEAFRETVKSFAEKFSIEEMRFVLRYKGKNMIIASDNVSAKKAL